jgi:ATP-binding cassette subfamily F protein uup
MTLLTLIDAELAYGLTPLLDRAQLSLVEGERVGLIGRNGTGKSSLLAAIAGRTPLDGGEIRRRDALQVALIEQEPELPPAATLRASLTRRGGLDAGHDERERWRLHARLVEYLHRFGLDEDADPARVSGGERKRATLALAFALQPDLLLLDEPTNHLDFDGIERLEALLIDEQRGGRAAVVVTHDRRFLDRVATRIVELDRGWLRSYPGNFAAYLARRTDELEAEASGRRKFDRFWAQEEGWIRKGVEARRTRNAGRVRRLEQLRRERGERRERLGDVKLRLDAGARSGRLVAELTDIGKRLGGQTIVQGLSLRLLRGDRLALLGRNGAGKSTLIRLILGELAPDTGSVKLGTQLRIAYFDQLRAQLDPDRTVAETIAPGSDWIEIGATRKHVMSYLADFLFPPRRAESPVRMLSGGERNRLLLARLFARSANLLVLDEPTNDLDIESLELLEATVADYDGTVVLVSHDREFVDAVATQSLVAQGGGVWKEYAGGYSDWVAQRAGAAAVPSVAGAAGPAARGAAASKPSPRAPAKPSFNEQRELQRLPAEIESLETEQSALHARMAAADYHRQGVERIKQDRARAAQLEQLLAQKFERWAELEQRTGPARAEPPPAG